MLSRSATLIGDAIPLGLYRKMVRRDTLGFLYHVISETPPPHIEHLYASKTPRMFEDDLLYLNDNFQFPDVGEICERREPEASSRTGRPAAFVSFDDGFAECRSVAAPILRRHRVPCLFFVVTDCIDNRDMMYRHKVSLCVGRMINLPEPQLRSCAGDLAATLGVASGDRTDLIRAALSLEEKDGGRVERACALLAVDPRAYLRINKPYLTQSQIKELASDGFKIGAHTRRHPLLSRLSPQEIETEIVESCQVVRDITGDAQVPFAFPFSGAGIARSFLQELRRKHPVVGPMFDTGGVAIDASFVFNRVTLDRPPPPGARGSNIPHLLHAAYRSVFLGDLKAKVQRRPRAAG